MSASKLLARLKPFCRGRVQFIVVDGVAAVLNGAPIDTFDLDLVYSRDPANIDRLLTALESLDAIFASSRNAVFDRREATWKPAVI